ncbi:hypothetical protein PAAG_03008 [Paracoccidioides lutzii Pb01]|uniref:Uncharacterized protein n=1 Tax=Paracoccidioides lutzii (strain ATCC MYA-826 / Pb01) TaxID=502779 RepID=C1GY54_PARBA|nr:hypothetical protein PAAG_03008 [Paracoccidioides lutzii Pb01]EEH41445.2 hypothetical protein PAAG_03008 [Paracoccidioides lutzii Pb01]
MGGLMADAARGQLLFPAAADLVNWAKHPNGNEFGVVMLVLEESPVADQIPRSLFKGRARQASVSPTRNSPASNHMPAIMSSGGEAFQAFQAFHQRLSTGSRQRGL